MRLIPKGKNLVVYYLLPLAGINPKVLGRTLKCAYLKPEDNTLWIEVSSFANLNNIKISPNYLYNIDIEGKLFIVVTVENKYHPDIAKFVAGKYSTMSKDAKTRIYKLSSLDYKKSYDGIVTTDFILQALSKSKKLKEVWINILGADVDIPDSHELIDKPAEDWFIAHHLK